MATTNLTSVFAIINKVQAELATTKVTPVAAEQMLQAQRKAFSSKASTSSVGSVLPVIIGLIIQNLPALISSGGQLAQIVQGWISQLQGGSSATLSPADVQSAVNNFNTAMVGWATAETTVCK